MGSTLLEISPNADPPVVKILDYGKFKYESQKKKNEAKKEAEGRRDQRGQGPAEHIDENDYQVKLRAMNSFIDEGDKVKVTLRFRGREMAHQDIGIKVLERIRGGHGREDQGGADAPHGKSSDDHGAFAKIAAGYGLGRAAGGHTPVVSGRKAQRLSAILCRKKAEDASAFLPYDTNPQLLAIRQVD